jgi:hypothetical protein
MPVSGATVTPVSPGIGATIVAIKPPNRPSARALLSLLDTEPLLPLAINGTLFCCAEQTSAAVGGLNAVPLPPLYL